MDLSIFERTDLESQIKILSASQFSSNTNPNVVTLCAFTGATDARQKESFNSAVSAAIKKYAAFGITLDYDSFGNDDIKHRLHYNPTQAIDRMMKADIHALPTHFHQGNLDGRAHPEWNMNNINANLNRLEWHVGVPNAEKIHCPVHRQDKGRLYENLTGLCVPTISLPLYEMAHEDVFVIGVIDRYNVM
jgi:hypothetical protein